MKNINLFKNNITRVVPLKNTNQQYDGGFSPHTEQTGIGFGMSFLAKQTYGAKNTVAFSVADTNSMIPWIDAGHVVVGVRLKEKDKDALRRGDVIIYKHHTMPHVQVVHQITRVRGDGSFITKGINNLFSDLPVMRDQVVYRVILWSCDR